MADDLTFAGLVRDHWDAVYRLLQSLTGDVHEDVANVAGWISPVPGGVGPMTITMLLANTLAAAALLDGA